MAGILKLFAPYTTMFAEMPSLSMSFLADPAKWVGPISEMTVGGLLFLSLFWTRYLSIKTAHYAFTSVNLALIAIMTVALVVHFHYDVPATILSFDCKYHVLAVVIMAFAARNIRIHHDVTRNLQFT